jgi:hypothetical protein
MEPTRHNYFRKVVELYIRGKLPTRSLAELDVHHDEWCEIHAGGYCNCNPEITLRPQFLRNRFLDRPAG